MREQKVPMTAAQRTLHRIKKDRVLYLILSPTIIYFVDHQFYEVCAAVPCVCHLCIGTERTAL